MSDWFQLLSHYASDLANAPGVKLFLSVGVVLLGKFFGLPHPAIQALMYLMLFDYFLGAAHAWKENRVQFARLKRGLGKFIVYGLAINITWLADEGMGTEALGFSLRNLLCGYLCANEALSALTHLAGFGVPIPPWLMHRLRKYRDSVGKTPPKPNHRTEEDSHDGS